MTFRVRRLSENLQDPLRVGGDMTFGRGYADFLIDSPTAVAQCVLTRLILWTGEWWLNLRSGTPWLPHILPRVLANPDAAPTERILSHPPTSVPDAAIRQRILTTAFVTDMTDYSSTYEPTNRFFTVSCKLYTAFGEVRIAPEGALISPSGVLVMPLQSAPVPIQRQLPPD